LQRYSDLTVFSKWRPSAILDLLGAGWDHPRRLLDGLVTANELGLAFPPRNLPKKFPPDPSTFYLVIVVTDKQTDKQTDRKTYAGDSIIPRESFRGDKKFFVIFHPFAHKPPHRRICTKFGAAVEAADVITCTKFFGDRSRGVYSVGGRKLPSPIDKASP